MLKAIFYARFHPGRGPSVIHQYPRDSIVARASSGEDTLVNFSEISSYVIPPYDLCNRPLSICVNQNRVLGFPISLEDGKYERNRFTFNVCFVLDDDKDSAPWQQVVKKTAAFFKGIEEEDGILQTEERLDGLKWAGDEAYPAKAVGVVYTMLQDIMEELNDYRETCVRVDDLNVLNLRLMPSEPTPPKVKAWDVPLLIRSLASPDEWTWDLVLQRMHPHIDGVKHVQRIAELADVEPKLVKKAVQELLYYKRAILLDMFHFQAMYALTSDFAWFVKDDAMQDECLAYVTIDHIKNIFKTTPVPAQKPLVSTSTQALIKLYQGLNHGTSLHDFCLNHEAELANIDIRRLINFGTIKGFLRRLHKYAMAIDTQPTPPKLKLSNGSTSTKNLSNDEAERDRDRAWKRAAFSSGWATPPAAPSGESVGKSATGSKSRGEDGNEDDEMLKSFLDGKHCMDEICVATHMSEKKLIERLRSGRFGEVVFFLQVITSQYF